MLSVVNKRANGTVELISEFKLGDAFCFYLHSLADLEMEIRRRMQLNVTLRDD